MTSAREIHGLDNVMIERRCLADHANWESASAIGVNLERLLRADSGFTLIFPSPDLRKALGLQRTSAFRCVREAQVTAICGRPASGNSRAPVTGFRVQPP
jgi:hypothetical protein